MSVPSDEPLLLAPSRGAGELERFALQLTLVGPRFGAAEPHSR